MKIESNGDEKITARLSTEDMHELDITYDEMDYSNIETRRVIWTILDEARRTLGKSIDTDSRILIEAAPSEDGGCVLHFTASPLYDAKSKKRLILKKETEPILFCAFDENAFIDALSVLKNLEGSLNSREPYKYSGNYYIIVRPKLTFSPMLERVLCEFGNAAVCTPCETAKIYEYGVALSE